MLYPDGPFSDDSLASDLASGAGVAAVAVSDFDSAFDSGFALGLVFDVLVFSLADIQIPVFLYNLTRSHRGRHGD